MSRFFRRNLRRWPQGERHEPDDVLGEGQDRLDDEARLRMGRVSEWYATYRSNDPFRRIRSRRSSVRFHPTESFCRFSVATRNDCTHRGVRTIFRRMRFEKIWVEQCRATKAIKRRFGAKSALDYLVGEKLPMFAAAADDCPRFAAELPKFLASVWQVFNDTKSLAMSPARSPRHEEPCEGFSICTDEHSPEVSWRFVEDSPQQTPGTTRH